MGDDEGPRDFKKDPGGRGPLPGFSAKVDMVSQYMIYGKVCDSENAYLQERQANPPVGKEPIGKIGRYKMAKKTSYIDIRVGTPSVVAKSTVSHGGSRVGSVVSHVSHHSHQSNHSHRSRHSERSASCGSLPPASPSRPGSGTASAVAAKQIVGSVPEEAPCEASIFRSPNGSFVLPKYSSSTMNSLGHMYNMTRSPNASKTSRAINSVIKPMPNCRALVQGS
eukprot:TRINITY_DN10235_c0_g1_i1.p1 TRINITY_DN10235_c0_g1~~TRINITY_DN10235_c0_g1_i1.p1  ORF type:complete len:223 (-),score=24.24 TRINITY_DN10235_c0_g1_i1:195-863(-)